MKTNLLRVFFFLSIKRLYYSQSTINYLEVECTSRRYNEFQIALENEYITVEYNLPLIMRKTMLI